MRLNPVRLDRSEWYNPQPDLSLRTRWAALDALSLSALFRSHLTSRKPLRRPALANRADRTRRHGTLDLVNRYAGSGTLRLARKFPAGKGTLSPGESVRWYSRWIGEKIEVR